MTKRTQNTQRHEVATPSRAHFNHETSREEISLAEFPVTTLAQRRPNANRIHIKESIGRDPQGQQLYRKWLVVGSEKYGLPIGGDEEVYVAITKLAEHDGFTERIQPITRYQICKLLGIKPDGRVYKRIGQAFHRFAGMRVHNDNVFRDPKTKLSIRDESFGIIDAFRFTDRSPRVQSATAHDGFPANYFRLGDEFLARMRNGNLKNLDLHFYRQLSTYLCKRLYRFLDKNAHKKVHYEIGLLKLAQRTPLSANYPEKKIKQILQRPLKELVERGFLSSFSVIKGRDGWKLKVTFSAKSSPRHDRTTQGAPQPSKTPKRPSQGNLAPFSAPSDADNALLATELVRRFHRHAHGTDGAPTSTSELSNARKLLRLQGGDADLAAYTVDFACHQATQTGFAMQNFGAVLTNGYPERARKHHEEDLRAKAHEDERRRRDELHDRYQGWCRRQIDERWKALSDTEREQLITDAEQRLRARSGNSTAPDSWPPGVFRSTAERSARSALGKELPRLQDWLNDQNAGA